MMEQLFKEILNFNPEHHVNDFFFIMSQLALNHNFGGTAWDQIIFPVSVPAHLFLRWGPYNLCTGL